VTCLKTFSAEVPRAGEEAFHEFLRETGDSNLIKTFLTFNCGYKGRFPAGAIVKMAREQLGYNFDVQIRDNVHGTVLNNWAHARTAQGLPIPDVVKVWNVDKTVVTPRIETPPEVPQVTGSQEHPAFDGPTTKADTQRIAQNWDKIGDPYASEKSSLSPGADSR
jgi:hypothetical protein